MLLQKLARFRKKDARSKAEENIQTQTDRSRELDLSGGISLLQLVKGLLQRDCKGGPIEQPMASLETTAQSALVLVPWLAGWGCCRGAPEASLVFVKSFSALLAQLLLGHQIIHGRAGLKQGVRWVHFMPAC